MNALFIHCVHLLQIPIQSRRMPDGFTHFLHGKHTQTPPEACMGHHFQFAWVAFSVEFCNNGTANKILLSTWDGQKRLILMGDSV